MNKISLRILKGTEYSLSKHKSGILFDDQLTNLGSDVDGYSPISTVKSWDEHVNRWADIVRTTTRVCHKLGV